MIRALHVSIICLFILKNVILCYFKLNRFISLNGLNKLIFISGKLKVIGNCSIAGVQIILKSQLYRTHIVNFSSIEHVSLPNPREFENKKKQSRKQGYGTGCCDDSWPWSRRKAPIMELNLNYVVFRILIWVPVFFVLSIFVKCLQFSAS